MSDLQGRLRAVGRPLPGARHDSYAYTASGLEATAGRHPGLGDKGYQGPQGFGKVVVEGRLCGWAGVEVGDHVGC